MRKARAKLPLLLAFDPTLASWLVEQLTGSPRSNQAEELQSQLNGKLIPGFDNDLQFDV